MLTGTNAADLFSAKLDIMLFKSLWKFEGRKLLSKLSSSEINVGERKERAKIKIAIRGIVLTTM